MRPQYQLKSEQTRSAKVIGAPFSQTVRYNQGGLFDMTAQKSPQRGISMKNTLNNMTTHYHTSVGPQFESTQTVFKVGRDYIRKKDPLRISQDTLTRL